MPNGFVVEDLDRAIDHRLIEAAPGLMNAFETIRAAARDRDGRDPVPRFQAPVRVFPWPARHARAAARYDRRPAFHHLRFDEDST